VRLFEGEPLRDAEESSHVDGESVEGFGGWSDAT
jgi:hypothetical protein